MPREGLVGWRDAVERHLRPMPGMTLVDVGAGTGAFAAAFCDWFGLDVVAVEPSAAMRGRISPGVRVLEGDAAALPLPDGSADAVWLSNVVQHIPDLEAAAHEIRRVLRPGAPILIRAGMSRSGRPGGYDRIELLRWFPELARTVDTFPSVEETCGAFAAAGFECEALEEVRETYPASLQQFLGQLDALRVADSPMRALTDEEFLRGKDRIARAAERTRSSWFDFLVLR